MASNVTNTATITSFVNAVDYRTIKRKLVYAPRLKSPFSEGQLFELMPRVIREKPVLYHTLKANTLYMLIALRIFAF